MIRYLVFIFTLLFAADAAAQPIPGQAWRPPTGCATNDFIKFNGTSWTCSGGAAATFNTNNTLPKGNGTTLVASRAVDDGTTFVITSATSRFAFDSSHYLDIQPKANHDTLIVGSGGSLYFAAYGATNSFVISSTDGRVSGNSSGTSSFTGTSANPTLTVTNSSTGPAFTTTSGDVRLATSGGSVGIGLSSSATTKLQVANGTPTALSAPAGTIASFDQADGTNAYVTIRAANASTAGFVFTDNFQALDGGMFHNASNGTWFTTNPGTSRLQIDNNGTIFAGDTSGTAVSNNVDVISIGQTGTGRTTTGKAGITFSDTGSVDTTSGNVDVYSIKINMAPTRSAGSNTVNARGIYIDAATSTGVTPYALYVNTGATKIAALELTAANQTLAGSTNDYALGADVSILRVDGPSGMAFTGFQGGRAGRQLWIYNVDAADNLRFQHENASSSATNRITMTGGFGTFSDLVPTCGIHFTYDGTTSRWVQDILSCWHLPGAVFDQEVDFNAAVKAFAGADIGDADADVLNITGHTYYKGTAPSLSGCAACTIASYSTDHRGTISCTDGPQTCTVTFATAYSTNPPSCVMSGTPSGFVVRFTSATSTSAFSFGTTSGINTYYYFCDGML